MKSKSLSFRFYLIFGFILGAVCTARAADNAAQDALMTPNGLIAPDGSKPLPPRKDTLSWAVLQQVQTVRKGDAYVPEFNKQQQQLNRKPIKLYGFMLPTQAGETQKEFILTPYPPSCPFCMSMGPDSVVQVVCDQPVKVTFEPIVVSGNFALTAGDPSGFYYRISGASAIEP